ncbi:MAG: PfkB family carbohydrate kinase [Desulfobacca sp.]|nr:PfkB family carbohydrate kinase [Desulfobacca sp.]
MKAAVVCLGALNVDRLYRVETLKPFAEVVPGLTAGGEYELTAFQEAVLQSRLAQEATMAGRSGGGQAANTAYALARWGQSVALVGRVGADDDGDFLLNGLAGVDCHIERQGASGRAYILVDQEGERTILVAPNTNDLLAWSDLPVPLIQEARFLHLTSFVGDQPLKVQIALAHQLTDGPHISLDPGELYSRQGRSSLAPLLARTDTLLVTETEWQLLGGEAFSWPDWAPQSIIVKLGRRGARLISPTGIIEAPTETDVTVVDTIGAGDVFAAGWLAAQLAGLDPRAALKLANRMAAASLTGPGREGYPDKALLLQQLAALRSTC